LDKVCNKCRLPKDLDCFTFKRGVCKTCRHQYYKDYRCDQVGTIRGLLKERMKDLRRRAKKSQRDVDIDLEYLLKLYQSQAGRCALSNMSMTIKGDTTQLGFTSYAVSVDRIDSTLGYTKGNIQLVCSNVNRMKGVMSMTEFKNMCKIIGAL
jgi:hypothetical protein